MSTFTSHIQRDLKFNQDHWIAHLIVLGEKRKNAEERCGCNAENLRSHAIVVIEGVRDGRPWITECDAIRTNSYYISEIQRRIKNEQGTMEIRVRAGHDYKRDFASFRSKSWCVTAVAATRMINSILQEKADLEAAIKKGTAAVDFPYQNVGSRSLVGGNGGDNCVTRAEKWLAIANAGNRLKIMDLCVASPPVHVHPIASDYRIFMPLIAATGATAGYLAKTALAILAKRRV